MRRMMGIRIVAGTALTAFMLLARVQLTAQDTLALNLDESIAVALDKSINIQQLRQSMRWAERNLWAAKAGYRTSITSSWYAPAYDEGFKLIEVVEGNPVAKRFGSSQVRGQMNLIQPMPWIPLGGADLTFRSEAYQLNSWTPSLLNPDDRIRSNKFYTSLSVIVNKPLFTINELALGLKQAELSYERQSRVFKRSELDLVYRVTNAFFQLYDRRQRLAIDREKVARQEAIYQTTSNKFKAGLIAEVDAMQAEVELIQYQNDLKLSEGQLSEQEAVFKQLIGLPMDTKVKTTAELELQPVVVDVDKARTAALQNRSELVEQEITIEEQKISIQQIDARVSIKGNLKGYYDLSGFSDPNSPWGTSTQDLFNSSWTQTKKTPNRGFTFELEVPIWDWGRNKAQVDAAKANMKRDELDLDDLRVTVGREVDDVVRSVSQTWDRVQMLAKSQEVSRKSMDISLKRFANGDITSTELARASDQLNNSKLSYLAAYIEYKMALADLKRKTLYDFEKDRPLVEVKPKK
jgi:outer membrane protein